jgi:hypothetical protein
MLIWPVRLKCDGDGCDTEGCGEVHWTGTGGPDVHAPNGWIMRDPPMNDRQKVEAMLDALVFHRGLDQKGQLLLCPTCATRDEVSGSDDPDTNTPTEPSTVESGE